MAKSYVESMLAEREKILYVARQHWFLLVSSILTEIVLILVFLAAIVTLSIFFQGYALIIVAIGFLLLMFPIVTGTRDVLAFTNHLYILTNRRVIQLSGVLDKQITDTSLEKVNDVKLTQSALGRIFDYGDIEILTASELGTNLFRRIEKPIQFKITMLNAKERLESGENHLPGDIAFAGATRSLPDLITQLDTLRQQGLLTDEEFQAKKTQLLSRL